MVFVGAVWPVLIQTMYGVQDVDPAYREVGRAYGLSRTRQFVRIVFLVVVAALVVRLGYDVLPGA